MWRNLSLKKRIFFLLAALTVITLAGSSFMIWYTYRMDSMLDQIINQNMAAFQTAAALETALINQKGFVSYYFQDNDPQWLEELAKYRQKFSERLKAARRLAKTPRQQEDIRQINEQYGQYIDLKDRVIGHYKNHTRQEGMKLHREVRHRFFKILEICEDYKLQQQLEIAELRKSSAAQARKLRLTAAAGLTLNMLLVLGLAVVFVQQILGPVTRLLEAVARDSNLRQPKNVMSALSQRVGDLIQNVDHAQVELKKSREHLLQSEKLALVGKLAAGMAHSIRNPFTSVKMRLFSLRRDLSLNKAQKDDFDVVSQEIRQIDTVVQNFLEFSRPPKLTMQPISPSVVVDNTIQLLAYRLKAYHVQVNISRQEQLPKVMADPDQLKEVLVNLMINACEAMGQGGQVHIRELTEQRTDGPLAIIEVKDSGAGIEKAFLSKIFQPFFTTKETGTGLGLSIVQRIVQEHGGTVQVTSENNHGTTFRINLPILKAVDDEQHPDH